MPFRRPNNITASAGRVQLPSTIPTAPRDSTAATRPERRASEGCSAGLAPDQGRRLSRGWLQQSWAATAASSATAPTSAFSTACVLYTAIPPWDSQKQPELARCPLKPSVKASWSQPFDVTALQWFRWIGPARWVNVLAVQKNVCKKVLLPPACQYRVPPQSPEIKNLCFPVHPQVRR